MNATAIILRKANFARIRRKPHNRLMQRVQRLTWLECRLLGRRMMKLEPDLRFQMAVCDQMVANGMPFADVAHIRGGIFGEAAKYEPVDSLAN